MHTQYGERSEEINEIAAGMSVFRGKVKLLERDATGPNGKYPSMSSVTRTIDSALHDTGLSYMQPVSDNGNGHKVIHTWLMHTSGQYIVNDNLVYVAGVQLEDQLGEVEAQAKRDLIGVFRLAASPLEGATEETAKSIYPSLSGDAKNHFDRVVKKLSDSKTDEEASAKVFDYIDSQVGKGIWNQEMVDLVKKEFAKEEK